MKRGLFLLLVVVVLVTGLPLAMGMEGMAFCPECGPAVLARAAECLPAAVLVALVGLTLAFAGRMRLVDLRLWPLLFSTVPERPPQTA